MHLRARARRHALNKDELMPHASVPVMPHMSVAIDIADAFALAHRRRTRRSPLCTEVLRRDCGACARICAVRQVIMTVIHALA